jgi:GT2 family glycosyltransferase
MTFEAIDLPLISIVISNFNGRKMLRECVSSLMNQTYPNREVILVDAGSTDGSPELIEQEFQAVKLVKERKIGIGEAINIGIRKSRGDLIVIDFNSDEIASRDWLSLLYAALESSSGVGAVGGIRIQYGSDYIDDAGCKIYFFGLPSKIGQGMEYENYTKEPYRVDFLTCMLIERKLVNRLGFVDENYFIYGEDVDYSLRVRKTGLELLCVPAAVTYHKVNLSIGSQTARQQYFLRRAQMRLVLKLFSPAKIFASLVWLGFVSVTDALAVVPLFGAAIAKTRYAYLYTTDSREGVKASIKALLWNFANLKSTFVARAKS